MSDRCVRLATACLVLAAAGTAACVHYEARPISSSDALAAYSRRSLADPGLQEFLRANDEPVPPAGGPWGTRALTLAAFFYLPDLDVARAELAAAEAGATSAGARENPAVALSAGYDTTTTAGLVSPWVLGFNLDIPLTTAGKRRHRIERASALADAARFNLAAAAWGARSRVRAALVELDAANRGAELLAQQETIEAENVGLLERQLDAGAVPPFEVTQARLALATTTLSRRDAETRRAAARGRLAEAIGVPGEALEGVSFAFGSLAASAPDVPTAELRRQAVLNRADVLGALAEYAAAQAELRIEIAKQYPDVHLGPGYEFDQGLHKWFLALSLPIPIVNGNRGPIAEAEARRTTAAARFTAVQAHAVAEVDQAAVAYEAAREGRATAERMGADLVRQERAAQARFEAGEISRLELGSASLERAVAALARLDAEVRALTALGQLEDAVQSPLGLPGSAWQRPPRQPGTQDDKERP